MGSSGGSSPVTTTQTKDPWSGAQPYLSNIYSSGQNLFNANIGYQPYTGQTQAALHPWQSQGLGDMYSIASGQMAGGNGFAPVTSAQNLANDMLTNQGLSQNLTDTAAKFGDIYTRNAGNQNPYLQGVIDQQMNKVNAGMSGAGRYGSGAHDAAIAAAIAPTLAQDYQARQQLQMGAAGAMGDIYGQGLQRAGSFAQLAPTLAEASYLPAQHMADVGQFYTQYAQQALNDQMKLYNAQQAYPWENLNRFAGLLQGAGQLGGTTVTNSPGPTNPSTTQRLFGGALAGAGLGSMFGPPGMAAGAVGGGLLGMLG